MTQIRQFAQLKHETTLTTNGFDQTLVDLNFDKSDNGEPMFTVKVSEFTNDFQYNNNSNTNQSQCNMHIQAYAYFSHLQEL